MLSTPVKRAVNRKERVKLNPSSFSNTPVGVHGREVDNYMADGDNYPG